MWIDSWKKCLFKTQFVTRLMGFTHHNNGWYHEPKHTHNGAFTFDVKSMLIENLGGILGGT